MTTSQFGLFDSSRFSQIGIPPTPSKPLNTRNIITCKAFHWAVSSVDALQVIMLRVFKGFEGVEGIPSEEQAHQAEDPAAVEGFDICVLDREGFPLDLPSIN